MVDASVINVMMETAILSFVVPVVLLAVWKMRTRKSIIPALVGAAVFLVFVKGLESIPHAFFIMTDNPISRVIRGNHWIYAIYGGLMAGLFEEMGRFITFRYLLNKHTCPETAITYGLGHGGIECMLVMGVANLQYFMYAQLINGNKIQEVIQSYQGDENAVRSLNALVEEISNMQVSTFIWGGIERLAAIFLQIALSILVFYAVREKNKKHFLWIAMGLHALVDFVAGFYQAGALSLEVTELTIILFTVIIVFFAYRIYQQFTVEEVKTETSSAGWEYAGQKYRSRTDSEKNKE